MSSKIVLGYNIIFYVLKAKSEAYFFSMLTKYEFIIMLCSVAKYYILMHLFGIQACLTSVRTLVLLKIEYSGPFYVLPCSF